MQVIECEQYSQRWWEVRRGIPTASEFSRIITPSKGEYAAGAETYINELIADRFNPGYLFREDYQTAAMRNGTILEPAARRFYEFERDCEVQQVGFVLSDDGWLGASPDGLPGDGVLELKAPTMAVHVKYLRAGTLPTEYKAQCHGHLLVTGRPWVDFMSYSEGLPPLLVRVEPDDFTESLRECLGKFLIAYDSALEKINSLIGAPPPVKTVDYGPVLGSVEYRATEVESYF